MTNKATSASKALACLRWCTAIAVIAVLTLLAAECIAIYRVGNSAANLDANGVHLTSVYSREDVVVRLKDLTIPFICCGVLIVLSAVTHTAYALPAAKGNGMTLENRLRLMKARVVALPAAAQKEEAFRRSLWIAAALLMTLCAVPCCIYLFNGSHFTSWDLEMVMGDMLLHVAPWVMAAFIIAIAAAYVSGRSVQRELDALKGAPMGKAEASAEKKTSRINAVRIALYAAAVLFIVLGVMNGGLRDVLVKAINICTECIGLG